MAKVIKKLFKKNPSEQTYEGRSGKKQRRQYDKLQAWVPHAGSRYLENFRQTKNRLYGKGFYSGNAFYKYLGKQTRKKRVKK